VENEGDDAGHAASLASEVSRPMRRVRAYIGLGANLGDSAATLASGIGALAALPHAQLRAVSRLYATEPVGVVDQPLFHNAVAALDVPAGPDPATGATALVIALKQLERAFGRQDRERWGPRELDLDLLVFGRARLSFDRPPDGLSLDPGKADRLLVVPHRDAAERLFVLAPLADVAAGLTPPGWHETVATAAARRRLVEGPGAALPVATWDRVAMRWRAISPDSERGSSRAVR
jgi:2-amino-4-hydroxy-6-hydroxymethyldihydropteridine diphosphokinase